MTQPTATSVAGPIGRARHLTDAAVVAMALAASAAAWFAPHIPVAVLVASIVGGALCTRRRPVLVVVVAAVLAASAAGHAWAGLVPPPPRAVHGPVRLVSDPEVTPAGTRALVTVEGVRAELWARGQPARALRSRLAGEHVVVTGGLTPMSEHQVRRRAPQRVVATLDAASVEPGGRASVPWRAANSVRRLLGRGAAPIAPGDRALFVGLVLGDDREEPAQLRDAFDAAGLSHLLAVSGQNVAFVMAAAAPLLRRLRLWPRFAAVVTLLVFFALVTRFEPSVLRAVGMALAACLAATLGRPVSGLRILALTVTALVLFDPLIVRALGFQLSVAATAGLVTLAPALARASQLPRGLATALSVPLAAQLATAPLLAATGRPVPLVAVPANVLAEPAAGFVMTWGSSAGLLAGAFPAVAPLVHLPTRLALWWTGKVAAVALAASLQLPPLRVLAGGGTALVMVALLVGRATRRPGVASPRHRLRSVALLVGAASVPLLIGVAGSRTGVGPSHLPPGATLWRAQGTAVLVVSRPLDGARLLTGLRRAGVDNVALVAVTSSASATWRGVTPTLQRYQPRLVLGSPPGPGVTAHPEAGTRYEVGTLVVEVRAIWPRLEVDVHPSPP